MKTILVWACVASLVQIELLAADEETSTTNAGVGTTVSYSIIRATHRLRAALPVAPGIYGRFFDLAEVGVFGAYNAPAGRRNFSGVIAGIDARLAPVIGSYLPFAGFGLAYAFYEQEILLPDDHMFAPFVTIAPLRFSLRNLLRISGPLHPILSLLQVRYGPFIFDGGDPSYFDLGNFILVLDVVRIGIFFGAN